MPRSPKTTTSIAIDRMGPVSSAPAPIPSRRRNPDIKIISGGQTGADRAALDVAMSLKIPVGGWCPADRRAEDGPIDRRYPLTPLPNAGYRERTFRNIADSDGTAIFSFRSPTGGSKATAACCRRLARPCLIINAATTTTTDAAILLAIFLLRHRIRVLNVAGPRASKQPAIRAYVTEALLNLLALHKRKRRRSLSIVAKTAIPDTKKNPAKSRARL